MSNERILELINAGIDGELSTSELSEFQQILDQSAEARSLQASWQALATTISGLPQRDPPDELRKNILEKVQLPGKRQKTYRFSATSPVTGYGLAIAAGLVMIVGIYQFGPRQSTPEDISRMTGTIAQQPTRGHAIDVDSLDIELEMVSGKVSLQGSDNEFILEFDLSTTQALEVVVELSDSGLEFSGFRGQDNSAGEANVTDGTIRVSIDSDQQFAVYLRRSGDNPGVEPAHIITEIYSDGARVHQGILKTQ